MKTHVTFQSKLFNHSVQKEYFVNPDCFGDDVCEFLGKQLQQAGVACDEPGPEDWGWILPIEFEGKNYFVGTNYHADGFWLAFVEQRKGILAAFFDRNKVLPAALLDHIHRILVNTAGIDDVRWLTGDQFNKGLYEDGARSPLE